MRQIIEVSDEGFESLLGETVTCFCMNYFYILLYWQTGWR
jgi:hypothetical protein